MNIQLVGAPEEVQYFGWAVEHLPEGKMLSGLLAVPNVLPINVALTSVQEVYQKYIFRGPSSYSYKGYSDSLRLLQKGTPLGRAPSASGEPLMYVDVVSSGREIEATVETAPDELYDADSHMPGTIDDLAYQAMLAGFLGTMDNNGEAIRLLGTLLLRGSLNRQLTIGRFVRMMTSDVPVFETDLPTKGEVVRLAQDLIRGNLPNEIELAPIIVQYQNFVSSSSDKGFNPPPGAA